jgi:hypothetical protein
MCGALQTELPAGTDSCMLAELNYLPGKTAAQRDTRGRMKNLTHGRTPPHPFMYPRR